MRRIDTSIHGWDAAVAALRRGTLQDDAATEQTVRGIIGRVRDEGDAALVDLGRRFDCPTLAELEVTEAEWDAGCRAVDPEARRSLERAAGNISAFHAKQRRVGWMDTHDGIVAGQMVRPVGRVGVYVPGGRAAYPSTVLMCALPAREAGVPHVQLCTPCGRDGAVHGAVLLAARLAGVERVFKVGGAQAVAAMAWGTATVPPVDKVVGPGNAYVNTAKRLLYGIVDIDMLAGPSEVCVVADAGADPASAAADMLSQAEHDPECAAFLITPSSDLAERVAAELERRVEALPRRDTLREALGRHGAILVTQDLEHAIELANLCAPEHLALMVRDPYRWVDRVRCAGAVLLGDYAPQTLGDYAAGPSHTLPTNGAARYASPLGVDTFLKRTSVIQCSREGLRGIAPDLVRLARLEGFEAHAEAVLARLPEA